jgi:two-component system KDP operon response regulator KdpE
MTNADVEGIIDDRIGARPPATGFEDSESSCSNRGAESRVLLIGSFRAVRGRLVDALSAEGVTVSTDLAAARLAPSPALLVVDDSTLEGPTADDLVKLRGEARVPVLFLHTEDDVEGPSWDTDETDGSPTHFGTARLLSRVLGSWSRARPSGSGRSNCVVEAGGLRCDFGRRSASVVGRSVALSPSQFDLFSVFMKNAGDALTHQQLLVSVWGPAYSNEVDYLRVHVGRLRQKFERYPSSPRHFVAAPGIGYRLSLGEMRSVSLG